MQGTAEAVEVKNKFLQDVNGPTSSFSMQDHVGGERGSYVFNSLISVNWTSRPHEFQGRIC